MHIRQEIHLDRARLLKQAQAILDRAKSQNRAPSSHERGMVDAILGQANRKPDQTTWRIDKAGRHMLEGAISTGAIDAHDSILVPEGMQCAGLPIPLYWNHEEDKQVGDIVWLRKTPAAVFARAVIDENQIHIHRAIADGSLNAFSVGLSSIDAPEVRGDGIAVYHKWALREVSLVKAPANHEARFWRWNHPRYQPVTLNSNR